MVGAKGFEILKAKKWVEEKGAVPSRIVLIKWITRDNKIRDYSTHIECNRNGRQEFYHGNYFETLDRAKKDFEKRGI